MKYRIASAIACRSPEESPCTINRNVTCYRDRIILVTGASDGIGREAALTYSRYSASVILVGRNEEKAAQRCARDSASGRHPRPLVHSGPVNLHAAGVPTAGAEDRHPLSAPRRCTTQRGAVGRCLPDGSAKAGSMAAGDAGERERHLYAHPGAASFIT